MKMETKIKRKRNRKIFILLGIAVIAFVVFQVLLIGKPTLETYREFGFCYILLVMGLAFIAYGFCSKEPVDYTQLLNEMNEKLERLEAKNIVDEAPPAKTVNRPGPRKTKESPVSSYEDLINKYTSEVPGDDFA